MMKQGADPMSEKQESAEAWVKARWPDAYAGQWCDEGPEKLAWEIWSSPHIEIPASLGRGDSRLEAWANAASRLDTPPGPDAQAEACQHAWMRKHGDEEDSAGQRYTDSWEECELCGIEREDVSPVAEMESGPKRKGSIPRCKKCGAGPLGNCGYFGADTPRETCPLNMTAKASSDASRPPVAESGESAHVPICVREVKGWDFGVTPGVSVACPIHIPGHVVTANPPPSAPEASAELLQCGHPSTYMMHSVESGEQLFCALCDCKDQATDRLIEQYTQPLQEKNHSLTVALNNMRETGADLLRQRDEAVQQELEAADKLRAQAQRITELEAALQRVTDFLTARHEQHQGERLHREKVHLFDAARQAEKLEDLCTAALREASNER